MLHLAAPTPPGWVERALAALDAVLLDHTHLEKKAASTALQLVFRYPEHTAWMQPLSALAREELEHFERMLGVLARRGVPYEKQKPSAYAGRLLKVARLEEPARCLDALLCGAMIEARSCERMQLLAAGLEAHGETELAEVYRGLLASEARHHVLYVELAEQVFGREPTQARLLEIAAHEAEVITSAWPEDRLHG